MKFQYIGDDEGQGPEVTNFCGQVRFRLHGEPVEVTDPFLVKKLQGNPTFLSEEVAARESGRAITKPKRKVRKRKASK